MPSAIKSYRDLEVWQKGMELVMQVYQKTRSFPREEQFGLVGQMRRAAISIPANIAEGHGRTHLKEYLNFLSTAYGSLMELETHIILAERLTYINSEAQALLKQTSELGRILNGLMKALAASK
jgi:four helix bundle protein